MKTGKDRHHLIQDARARELEGYSRNEAPTDLLKGPSFIPATEHGSATAAQRMINRILRSKGKTEMSYRRARSAMRAEMKAAGRSPESIEEALEAADDYFIRRLGLSMDTMLRVPDR